MKRYEREQRIQDRLDAKGLCSWVDGALSVGGSLLSGSMSRSAADSAALTQQAAANQAIQQVGQNTQAANSVIADNVNQVYQNLNPYANIGTASLSTLAGLLGQNGSMTPDQIMALDPGYQFRMNQGQTALENNAAKTQGPGLSGATLKELTNYGQNYASNEFQNIFNRQQSAANMGMAAAGTESNASMTGAGAVSGNIIGGSNQITNLTTGAANANAAGNVTGANIASSGINSAINNYNQQQTLKTIFSGGGNGTSSPTSGWPAGTSPNAPLASPYLA